MELPYLALLLVTGFVVVFTLVMRVGFLILPRAVEPELEAIEGLHEIELPEGLPEVVRQFITENIGSPALVPQTVSAWGRGWLSSGKKFFFSLLWLPVAWEAYLLPGEGYFLKMRVTWFGRSFFISKDVYFRGVGRFEAGTTKVEGKNVARGEETVSWLYALLLAPSALLLQPGVTWEELDDDRVKLIISSETGEDLEYTLQFDREKAELLRVDTIRPTARGGNLLPYYTQYSDYRQNNEGLILPARLLAVWQDDPYSRLIVEGVRYNMDVRSVIEAETVGQGSDLVPAQADEPSGEAEETSTGTEASG